jgi:protoporphyrinogen/coproporphyrinogen III oxidase
VRVAVVGAGPAGLAAAWRLVQSGAEPVIFEAAARPGGLLRTELMDGAHVDVAVQLVGSPHTSLFRLAREAGVESLLQRSPGHDALWRRGRPHGLTYGSIPSMVASGALPMTLKLKLAARYVPFLKHEARQLDVNDPVGSGGAAYDDESIGAWGRRELGSEFVELLAYPLLAAYYGAEPEEVGAGIYHALARVGMDVSVYGAAGGFGALAAALAQALETRGARFGYDTAVESVEDAGDDVVVDGDRFDAAVLAVPANRAARLLAADRPLAQWLGGVDARPTLTLALRFDRRFPGDWFGLSFPRGEGAGRRIAAVCVMSRKLPGMVREGDGDAVVVMPAPSATPSLLELDDDAVTELLLSSLESAIQGIGTRLRGARVFRFGEGYSVFGVGHVRRLAAGLGDMGRGRVALAGDYLMAPSVEGAVRSGLRAADQVLRFMPREG